MVAMLVVPTSETARATPWGPWLYAVIVSGQVSSMSCTRARKRAAARVEEMGSRRSSTRLSTRMKSRPVLGMNCQTPAAPALEYARRLKHDSMSGRRTSSTGRPSSRKMCSISRAYFPEMEDIFREALLAEDVLHLGEVGARGADALGEALAESTLAVQPLVVRGGQEAI